MSKNTYIQLKVKLHVHSTMQFPLCIVHYALLMCIFTMQICQHSKGDHFSEVFMPSHGVVSCLMDPPPTQEAMPPYIRTCLGFGQWGLRVGFLPWISHIFSKINFLGDHGLVKLGDICPLLKNMVEMSCPCIYIMRVTPNIG
jgi:hypothetical protein